MAERPPSRRERVATRYASLAGALASPTTEGVLPLAEGHFTIERARTLKGPQDQKRRKKLTRAGK